MDAAGKDSTIKHVFSGVNPQGCQVTPSRPLAEELDHDFLWRARRLPERGPHRHLQPVVLRGGARRPRAPGDPERQKLPPSSLGQEIWDGGSRTSTPSRSTSARNGTSVRKFFLNVSKEEQKKRFLERLDKPDKNWKFLRTRTSPERARSGTTTWRPTKR
jgi:hypothetical protein